MTNGILTAGLLILAVAASGCTEGSQGAVTIVDSAGVEVVTNLPGSIESAEVWSLSAEPLLEVGAGASPDVALFRVTAVVALDGGRLAVGTNTPPQVLIFEPDGTLTATLGRAGEGPGEYLSVGSVVPLPADSVAVWDPDRRRISVFTADGRYAREVDLSAIAPVSARSAPNDRVTSGFTHLLPSSPGSLILFGEGIFSSNPAPGVKRVELPAYWITSDGEELASFGPFPGMETFRGGATGGVPLPFGARTYATTSRDTLVVGTADATEFRMYVPDGALARIVRWPDHDRTVGGPFLTRWSDMLEDTPPSIAEFLEPVPRTERFPAYEGLLATDRGEILVGDYPGPVGILPLRRADEGPEAFQPVIRIPARRWLVFDAAGAVAATFTTPEGFEPYAVREGRLWGVYTDELDVESIRAYEIMKRPE